MDARKLSALYGLNDKARVIQTFGDMGDVVETLLPATWNGCGSGRRTGV